ncbi:ABC transporter permease [Glaesserella parasuis]|uniref:ABC transporter permease n=1 Tax=Glaesserella parasuis TaxID=738 RepID=UPI0013661362|nr:ABC transporter permease [Glaesserella parasuis]MWP85326.1 ABC transporter permease [Glaesserella parasuis]
MSQATLKKIINTYGMVLILIILFLLLSVSIEGFFSARTVWSIIEQVSMFGIIAIGVTFAIITTGIDLSSGSVVALTSVVAASMVTGGDLASSAILAFAMSLALGAFLGAINGGLTALGSIPPFIATLGMMIIARGAAQLYSAGRPIDASSETFTWIADVNILGLPGLVILYILIVIGSHILLSRSTFGRHVYAVGGNLNAAKICGINTTKTLILVYTFAGALSGLAGALLAARTYGNPSYGLAWELDAIAAAVIGGVSLSGGFGTIPMCVIGALIIGTTNKGLNMLGVDPYWQQIVKGGIIVIAVLLDTLKRRRKAA